LGALGKGAVLFKNGSEKGEDCKSLMADQPPEGERVSMSDRMEKSRLIDVVIINYNSTAFILRCIDRLYVALDGIDATIFVQDNASEDFVERITEVFPEVRLWRSPFNMGFAKAVNEALKRSDAPFILILNPDTYMDNGFFKPVLDFLEENQDVGIIGPRILNPDGSVQGSARAYPTPLTAFFGRASVMSKWFPNNPITARNLPSRRSDGVTPMDVDWVSGACMVVRREAVNMVGLLDERFFMYWEDADWCRRMWEKGWRVVYFPRASIVHFVGGSSEQLMLRSILEFHKSVYRLYEKYNTRYPTIIKPMVIGGLALRLVPVVVMNGIRVLVQRNR
jgi:GT2 family glycosyltransferase